MNSTSWNRLQTIDRRIIYALLLLFIIFPLFIDIPLPTYPSRQSRDFYDTLEKVAADKNNANKIVIVNGMWSPSTRGENQWQAEALITHLMQKHLRFATLTFDTQNDTVMQTSVVEPLAKKYGYVYGRDYVNWGYRPNAVYVITIKGLVTNIPGTIKKDAHGTPITSFAVMKDVKTRSDVAAVVDITPVESTETWLGLFEHTVDQKNSPPYLFAPTAVMAPTYYPYLDSGQIQGMLTGIKGAGDYEGLLHTKSFGSRIASALSLVYALIILLVIIGNVGYFATRAAKRREAS